MFDFNPPTCEATEQERRLGASRQASGTPAATGSRFGFRHAHGKRGERWGAGSASWPKPWEHPLTTRRMCHPPMSQVEAQQGHRRVTSSTSGVCRCVCADPNTPACAPQTQHFFLTRSKITKADDFRSFSCSIIDSLSSINITPYSFFIVDSSE